ncbi:MAG: HAD family phosphatase [Bacteroidetes bacterium]|nr:HAD family phosphatase [Bacteroidota bacterium]MCL5737972.1 HAD family phosphatase [Bacteroidota bacterium]
MEQKYSVIVFDLGNVLLPFDYKIILEKLEHVEKGLGSKFAEFYKNNYEVHRRFERGEFSADEFTEIMLDVLGHKVGKEDFYEIYSKIFTLNEELVAALPVLKKNYGLVLLSNTNDIHHRYGWRDYGFLKYFDKLILSHEVGAVKPETGIYKAVEVYTRVLPGEHFYVDDILEYVSAARELGWDGVQFVGNKELFWEFNKRGIIFEGEISD